MTTLMVAAGFPKDWPKLGLLNLEHLFHLSNEPEVSQDKAKVLN